MQDVMTWCEKLADWNIKGRYRYAGFSRVNCLCDLQFARHLLGHIEVPRWRHRRRGELYE